MKSKKNNKAAGSRAASEINNKTEKKGGTHGSREIKTNPVLRLNFMLICFVFALIFVGIIQVFLIKQKSDVYENAAISNQINKVQDKVINPNRGDIVDRNGEELALGETVYNIILDVRLLLEQKQDKQAETLEKINSILGIPMETLQGYIALDKNNKPAKDTHYLIIAKKVPFNKGKEINDLEMNWLYGEQDTKRSYPHGTLAAQIIGFLRGDTVWGLESSYNDSMVGVPGRTFRTYESNGYIMTQSEAPVKGNKLVTTIDANIQQYAENVCKTAYDEYDPEYTASIVMNPNTGEVYAMAQYPSFDLNDPMKLTDLSKAKVSSAWANMSDEDKYKLANKAWQNFCLTGTFEPGSIYKPIVVAMALEEGVISTSDTFECGGSLKVADYTIHCHNRNGHGTLTLNQALAQSCNVAMMRIISKLGADKYLKYQADFGFGEKTGIDLPGEVSASNLLYTKEQLHTAELATSSFGQGFNCTPIQAITAFSSLINGGKLMQPYVVSKVLDNDGNVVMENSPKVVRSVISKTTSDYLRVALQDTMTEGTGKKAVVKGYAMGGKTGTAQQGDRTKQKYTLSFIAYHSVDNPDLIMMTIIHKPSGYSDAGGAATPAPMMKKLMEDIINYEAIPPDDDSADGTSDKTDSQEYTVKDYTNTSLKNAISQLIAEGIDFEVIGSGNTVAKQSPAAGTKLESKPTRILLNISTVGSPKLVPVPDVTGLSTSDAKRMLESSGFEASIVEDSYASVEGTTSVVETTTQPETTAPENELVEKNTESETQAVEQSSGKKVYVQMPSASVKVEQGTTVRIRAK